MWGSACCCSVTAEQPKRQQQLSRAAARALRQAARVWRGSHAMLRCSADAHLTSPLLCTKPVGNISHYIRDFKLLSMWVMENQFETLTDHKKIYHLGWNRCKAVRHHHNLLQHRSLCLAHIQCWMMLLVCVCRQLISHLSYSLNSSLKNIQLSQVLQLYL